MQYQIYKCVSAGPFLATFNSPLMCGWTLFELQCVFVAVWTTSVWIVKNNKGLTFMEAMLSSWMGIHDPSLALLFSATFLKPWCNLSKNVKYFFLSLLSSVSTNYLVCVCVTDHDRSQVDVLLQLYSHNTVHYIWFAAEVILLGLRTCSQVKRRHWFTQWLKRRVSTQVSAYWGLEWWVTPLGEICPPQKNNGSD